MNKYNRQKGHNWERECVQILKAAGYTDCITARAGDRSEDSNGIDLLNTEPLLVQCKNMQKYASGKVLKTIKKSRPEDMPVVFSKAVREQPIAILYFNDFVRLLTFRNKNKYTINM